MLLAACGSDVASTSSVVVSVPETALIATTTSSSIAEPSTTVVDPTSVDTGDILGFGLESVTVGDQTLVVAIADTADLRQRGLMGVIDFGDVDGMLFEFDILTLGGFWMKDTLVPLDIAFFDENGDLIQIMTMTPCVTEDCPSHTPNGAYKWALERPAGTLLGSPGDLTLNRK